MLLKVVVTRPETKERTGKAASSVAVLHIVLPVNAKPGSVVFDHAVNNGGIVDCIHDVVEGGRSHAVRPDTVIPFGCVLVDGGLWPIVLGEKEPVVPGSGKAPVHALEMFDNRNAVDDCKPCDRTG